MSRPMPDTVPSTPTIRKSIHAAVFGHDWSAEGLSPSLAQAAALGYDHLVVPVRHHAGIRPDALARVFAEHGMSPLNTSGLGLDQDIGSADDATRTRGIEQLRASIALARDMGSTQIGGVLYGPLHKAPRAASRDAFLRAAESMHNVADHAAAAGVRLALEVVNRYETPLLFTTRRALAFLDAVDHDNVFLHLDTYHMSIEESDPFAALQSALPRLAYLELDQSHRGDAYDGSLDLVAWARTAFRLGYGGIVGVEAFTRQLMGEDFANMLAIWKETYQDAHALARNFMQVIHAGFRARDD